MVNNLIRRRDHTVSRLITLLRQRDGMLQQPIERVAGAHVKINNRWVLNFTSSNYLGLSRHPQVVHATDAAAAAWGVSLATPRLLATDRLTRRLEQAVATLVGQEAALVFPSTTHVALDLLPLLAGPRGVLFMDAQAYPISRAGAALAAQCGAQIHHFPHNDVQGLARALAAHTRNPDKVIVCDGFYPAGGHPADLLAFARLAHRFDAVIYVDDAHGIGVLGANSTSAYPYGHGGGGTPHFLGVPVGNIVHVGSLSKAFGVPVAFVAGTRHFCDYLRATVGSYAHSSPPAIPIVAAALAALHVHAKYGELLRDRLVRRVRHFRANLAKAGITVASSSLFPIQTLCFPTPALTRYVGRELRQQGIWAVAQFNPPDCPSGGVLRFVITAQHTIDNIDAATERIARSLRVVTSL